jgi:hypothetical protein
LSARIASAVDKTAGTFFVTFAPDSAHFLAVAVELSNGYVTVSNLQSHA